MCVGFVHQCFYEVFDHLGPHNAWWVWNPDSDPNQPSIAAVPINSIYLFATLGPFVLTWLVKTLACNAGASSSRIVGGTVLAGLLTPLVLVVASAPSAVAGMLAGDAKTTAQGIVMMTVVAVFAVVALTVLPAEWRRNRTSGTADDRSSRNFVMLGGSTFCAVFLGLWIAALPDLLTNDATRHPGSVLYAGVCFILAALIVAAVATGTPRAFDREPQSASTSSADDAQEKPQPHVEPAG
ncbi:hypothetical protein AAFP35_11470 [Gordonia sp. CPCC 206044]|uniref:hypothetical protein n=1 Tax=Gordonia sp. CPCC 206044 TaxID=3140793 RepID=UPI003AF39CF0